MVVDPDDPHTDPVDEGDEAPADGVGGPAPTARTGRRMSGRELVVGLAFLVPALILLGVFLVYPVFFTVGRSLFSRSGDFVGVDNYRKMVDSDATRTAIKNNVIWVLVAPAIAASIGLVFAVLTERIKLGTAFKLLIFMPMAVSFLASGVIFRLVYDESPDIGVLNAAGRVVVDTFRDPGRYPRARPVDESFEAERGGFTSDEVFEPGSSILLGVVGIPPKEVDENAEPARAPPEAADDVVNGVVWLDFTRGGGGERGVIDPEELGLSGMSVELVDADGGIAGRATTDEFGRFEVDGIESAVSPRLASSNFRTAWPGKTWLGPSLVTPAVIGAFLWIWTGFAMMLIAAGLAAIPRETMEAARVDGATEWQVFRRVTVPLLRPVLLVVVVTLMINVLKIFDLVLVIPPASTQAQANVIALEMWRVSFGGGRDHGLGSALGVLLFVLVLPAMLFNIKRFRSEEG